MNINIHNLFKFKIEGINNKQLKHLHRNFSYFQTDDEIKSELDIIVSDFTPDNKDCYILNDKYYIKDNYIFCNDVYKNVRWNICIKDIDNKPTVHFKGGIFSEIFLRDFIIEPLIAFKLAQKGYSLLHASSSVIDDKGFLFVGGPGSGKTSIILNLIRNKTAFLSDEMTLLSNNAVIYNYPSSIRIYNHNTINNPHLCKKLTLADIFGIKLKYLIYIFSLKYIKFPQYIKAENLFDRIEKKSRLHSLIFLSKTTKNKINLIQEVDKKELVKRLILVNKFQFKSFSEYISIYAHYYPESEIASYWEILENNLFNCVKNVHCYEIEIPSNYDYNNFNEFNKILNDIGAL